MPYCCWPSRPCWWRHNPTSSPKRVLPLRYRLKCLFRSASKKNGSSLRVAFDPHYKEAKADRIAKARVLGKQVILREIAGQNTRFSHQILSEIIWLISSTADFKRIDQRLADLQTSLDHPEREAEAEEPDMNAAPERPTTRGSDQGDSTLDQELEFLWQDRGRSGQAYDVYLGRISRNPVVRSRVSGKYFIVPMVCSRKSCRILRFGGDIHLITRTRIPACLFAAPWKGLKTPSPRLCETTREPLESDVTNS